MKLLVILFMIQKLQTEKNKKESSKYPTLHLLSIILKYSVDMKLHVEELNSISVKHWCINKLKWHNLNCLVFANRIISSMMSAEPFEV